MESSVEQSYHMLIAMLARTPRTEWEECCTRMFRKVLLRGKRGTLQKMQEILAERKTHRQKKTPVQLRIAHAMDARLFTPFIHHLMGDAPTTVTTIIDPKLVGGFELESNFTILHGSLLAELKRLQKLLHQR